MIFAIFISFDLGILSFIASTDSTRISLIIITLFVISSLFVGYRNWRIVQEYKISYFLKELFEASAYKLDNIPTVLHSKSTSFTAKYLYQLSTNKSEKDVSQLGELYAEALSGPNKIAWFMSGILIKLGLLGTVIGFVLMLGTVSDLDSLDISGVKQLMQQMTQGMGVAMFTTMTGLIGSMLLSLQCLMLERSTDKLVSVTVTMGQALHLRQEIPATQATSHTPTNSYTGGARGSI